MRLWSQKDAGSLHGYNMCMTTTPRYTDEHARAGLATHFPEIETWENQFRGYEIVIDNPE
ncbi:MAG: 7-cyano-7-deazaguanine reductase, partial [Acidobacteriaceae bacterium]|nr:7-cyano-7-deazaguanine reductase [Acidobacteriaceae bacterium]